MEEHGHEMGTGAIGEALVVGVEEKKVNLVRKLLRDCILNVALGAGDTFTVTALHDAFLLNQRHQPCGLILPSTFTHHGLFGA